jgi:GTP-binding protein HflX
VFFKKILLVQITTINCVIIAIIEKGDTMEKGIIVGANTNQLDDIFIKELEELKNLCEACEIEILDTITQNIKSINPKYYIGTGKVKELKELAAYHNVDCIIFNDELSPMQILNIEKATDKDIYDRT